MTATQLIQKLSQIMAKHGDQDVEVRFWDIDGLSKVEKVTLRTENEEAVIIIS